MRILITSDTHFGHTSMLTLCNRPVNYGAKLLDSFEQMVTPQTTVIHLGDVCIGNDAAHHARMMEEKRLGGARNRWLVRGNHDGKSNNWYLNAGWNWVGRSMSLKMFGHNILLTHAPASPEVLDAGGYTLNVHGHLHLGHREGGNDPRNVLISLERDGYTLFSLQELCNRFDAERRKNGA